MNHANNICRYGKTTEKRKSTAIAPAIGTVRTLDEKAKGCRGTIKRQTQIRSACDVANAFLGTTFYPRLQESETIQDCDRMKMDRDFKKSLSLLANKFKLPLKDCKNIPFPYNISQSMANLKESLKVVADWREIRLVHHDNCTYFARADRYDTGMSLYYIPVIPLYNILHKKETARIGKLLVSVYAYIYQVLDVPYYRNDCYLNSMYDMLENWIMDDGAEEDFLGEIEEAKHIGNFMKNLISDPKNLYNFKKRINSFAPKSDFEKELFALATAFFELYTKYPKVKIDRKFYPLRYNDENEGNGRPIAMDSYVSFCASISGCLFESLCQTVNDDLQEYSEIDEPIRFIPFDNRKIENNDFDFEHTVFESIDNLIGIWQKYNF